MTDVSRRVFLGSLPVILPLSGVRLRAQTSTAPFRVAGLSQLTLTVSDVKRSTEFYQALFGMPIQARQGATVLLRIGAGPKFLALRQADGGERPSISAFGFAIQGFNLRTARQTLEAHGVIPAQSGTRPGPTEYIVNSSQAGAAGSPRGSDLLLVADPSGVVFQMHDVSYCGGGGELGNVCGAVEPSARNGVITLTDMSHFTINATSPETVPFYLRLFGFTPQAYQAATPAWGVGDGVHFLMFTGNAGGPTRGGGAPPRAGGPADAAQGRGGAPAAGARPGGPGGRGGALRAGIDHACVAMPDFDPAKVTQLLVDHGLTKREGQSRDPLVTYISLRMPNRGGAEGGTPELYFTDPDGLAIQIQDVKYCGGGGLLGEVCSSV